MTFWGLIFVQKRAILFLAAILVVLAALCPTIAISGPAQTTADAGTPPTFSIGSTPFKFIGGFLPGWHWGTYGNIAADDDQIASARATGITVMHLMLPQFETSPGVYSEAMLARLDRYLDQANKSNVYVMISFIQAYSETLVPGNPYYHTRSIEGIIKDQTLRDRFKNRIAALVNRQNTVNHTYYKDDPTILAWIVCDEPVSAPSNYPNGRTADNAGRPDKLAPGDRFPYKKPGPESPSSPSMLSRPSRDFSGPRPTTIKPWVFLNLISFTWRMRDWMF